MFLDFKLGKITSQERVSRQDVQLRFKKKIRVVSRMLRGF